MGRDKALMEINGIRFIDAIYDACEGFEEKIIARGNQTEIYEKNWNVISDIYQERGPIGGIHSALSKCQSEALFCTSCDVPFLKTALIERLCRELEEGSDAVIAVEQDGRIHPTCGVYRKTILPVLEQQIQSGNNKMMHVLNKVQVKYVEVDPEEVHQLCNINTPEELTFYRGISV